MREIGRMAWGMVALAMVVATWRSASAAPIGEALAARLAAGPTGAPLRVLVRLRSEQAPPLDEALPRATRRGERLARLREAHAARAARVAAIVGARPGQARVVRDLWIGNALEIEASAEVVQDLAAAPEVEQLELVRIAATIVPIEDGPEPDDVPPAVYGVRRIRAPQVWALGTRGQGAVVAVIDTGVRATHPDLRGRWRSRHGWLDAVEGSRTPVDANGHGTHVTGTIVGGNVAGPNFIGVAPRAQFIACRAFDASGYALDADLLECMQWVADPDGNPATDDAPDAVNNSWGLLNDLCDTAFDRAAAVWRDLDIVGVFGSGNQGIPVNPANGRTVLAVGAIDRNDQVPWWSGHGISRCGGIYPDLVAPGVKVRSAWPGGTRKNLRGTSMAAPHVAGTVALMRSRRPQTTAAEIANILRTAAVDLGEPGPDYVYGYGLVDAYRSVLCLDRGSFSGCHAQCP